jgi:hypothetical protein
LSSAASSRRRRGNVTALLKDLAVAALAGYLGGHEGDRAVRDQAVTGSDRPRQPGIGERTIRTRSAPSSTRGNPGQQTDAMERRQLQNGQNTPSTSGCSATNEQPLAFDLNVRYRDKFPVVNRSVVSFAAREPSSVSSTDNTIALFAGLLDGSDGTRTRDLRRDRPSRAQRRPATNSCKWSHLQVLFALRPPRLRMVEPIVASTFGPRVGHECCQA